jgi:cytochrome c oxidase subunit 2
MKRTRKALIALSAAALLLLTASPAAAQASTSAELINELNDKLLVVALPITLLVEGILIYAVLKFRGNDDPQPTQENRRLEITWTIATAIVLLFVGFAAFEVMASPEISTVAEQEPQPSEGDVVVNVTGTNGWQWQFDYGGQYDGVQTTNEVHIPEGQQVYFRVTAEDWLHMMHVPDLGLKQQAQPGTVTTITTTPTETGDFQGYCTEYCGVGHSTMLFEVHVVSQDDFEDEIQSRMEENGSNESGDGQ